MTGSGYSLVVALVAANLMICMLLMSAFRRTRALAIHASAFAGSFIGFLILLMPLDPAGTPVVISSNLLITWQYLAMAWGLRTGFGLPRSWPRRFWIYAGLMGAFLPLHLFFRESFSVRATVLTAVLVCLLLEIGAAFLSEKRQLPPSLRGGALVLTGINILAYLGRILLVYLSACGMIPEGSTVVTSYTFLSVMGCLILWAGMLIMVEAAGLLEELQEKNRALRELAVTDELTGLYNRHQLDLRLPAELERSARYGQPLSLVMFDIDHFKNVNDTWGHQTGDHVLLQIARTCRNLIREPDNIFRWGGEEFLIIAPHTGMEGASALAEKLREVIARIDMHPCGTVTASFGVAQWRTGDPQDVLFRQVDHALYRAKDGGRNRVVAFGLEERLSPVQLRLVWQSDWASGNADIDREHRILLDLGNRVLELSLTEGSTELLPALDALLDHIARHFGHEEAILQAAKYPEADEHARVHQRLLSEAAQLRTETAEGRADQGALMRFVVGTVVNQHMLGADTRYFQWVQNRKA